MILLTSKQVAKYLRLHPMTVYRMTSEGSLPFVKFGGSYRYPAEHIDKMLSGEMSFKKTKSVKKRGRCGKSK